MSWWIYLEDQDGQTVTVDRHSEGGTYALGGVPEAELNVTYNYGKHFDFKKLQGKRAGDIAAELDAEVARLGTERHSDYWKPTEGNAGYALSILATWGKQHPDATWRVS